MLTWMLLLGQQRRVCGRFFEKASSHELRAASFGLVYAEDLGPSFFRLTARSSKLEAYLQSKHPLKPARQSLKSSNLNIQAALLD